MLRQAGPRWASAQTLFSLSPEALLETYLSLRRTGAAASSGLSSSSNEKTRASSEFSAAALSSNVPSSLWPSFFASTSQGESSIGAITSPIYTASSSSATGTKDIYSISFASPSAGIKTAKTFQTSLQGRPAVSVGREHSLDEYLTVAQKGSSYSAAQAEEDSGFEAFMNRGKEGRWSFVDRGGVGTNTMQLGANGKLKELEDFDPDEIILFQADRTQPLLQALSSYPSRTAITGLTASSTPFLSPTGKPYTLFLDGKEVDKGVSAVGLAVQRNSNSEPDIKREFDRLELVDKTVYNVTSAKGNIVLQLSECPAARLLLDSVRGLPDFKDKEKEYYAAVFDTTTQVSGSDFASRSWVDKAKMIVRIMSGDPSRGALSFETGQEVMEGESVVFLHLPSAASVSDGTSHCAPETLQFASQSSPFVLSVDKASRAGSASVLGKILSGEVGSQETAMMQGFLALSENGVIMRMHGGRIETVGINGASVTLR